MSTAIKVENLSKIYQIGEIGTGTLSRDLERWWVTRILGKEDPFLKIGQTNDRSKKGESDVVYSLQDINFEIEQGEAVGIIGKNGAGKSTLLKILSRVTSPTTGKIQVRGRVASLLEVGTGFHPELTGRENIYLNGAILGMRKKEITRKLDEIIDFSGVERYIDTPVKRYSSGMYVRLAFAVAAHLESEILIVDEVLAVGDAEFQKKCLGKMGDVSKGEGRTVLFVSHNLTSVKQLCDKTILLQNGNIALINETSRVIEHYLADHMNFQAKDNGDNKKTFANEYFSISNIQIFNEDNIESDVVEMGRSMFIRMNFTTRICKPLISVYVYNHQEIRINQIVSSDFGVFTIDKDVEYVLHINISEVRWMPGDYSLSFIFEELTQVDNSISVSMDKIVMFRVENCGIYSNRSLEKANAIFFEKMNIKFEKLEVYAS